MYSKRFEDDFCFLLLLRHWTRYALTRGTVSEDVVVNEGDGVDNAQEVNNGEDLVHAQQEEGALLSCLRISVLLVWVFG